MPRSRTIAKTVHRDPALLPDALGLGACTLERFRTSGLIAKLEVWLPVSRNGGYTVAPVFAALAVYFLARTGGGIQRFLRGLGGMLGRRLAAIVRLRTLPSSSAMSRMLGGLDHASVRSFLDHLLPEPIAEAGILKHPSVHHLDARGEPCHVVDVDPTVRPRRQRELPDDEERFAGVRRCVGEPGYVGRHRGEIRNRTVPAIHDGSGLWLAVRLLENEGSIVPTFRDLVDRSLTVLGAEGVPPERVIFRGDGEFGSTLALLAPVSRKSHVITRISRYSLLQHEAVERHLQGVTWHPVRKGESGIPKEAAELGIFQLVNEAGDQVEMRVVIYRIPASSTEKSENEYGFHLGGHHIGLLATSLDAERWPAPDVVELHMGRSSIENRFLQEDRELDLGHTVSENPAGQEFAVGVGLFLWNEQICSGWRRRPPIIAPRRQKRRPSPVASFAEAPLTGSTDAGPENLGATEIPEVRTEDIPDLQHLDAEPPGTTEIPEVQTEEKPPASLELVASEDLPDPPRSEPVPEAPTEAALTLKDTTSESPSLNEPLSPVTHARRALGEVLLRAFADLNRRSGWSIEAEAGIVRCPNRQVLSPYNLAKPASGEPRLSVRTDPHACLGCPFRPGCFPVERRGAYKQVSRALTAQESLVASPALATLRSKESALTRHSPHRPLTQPSPPSAPSDRPFYQTPVYTEPGPCFAERPVFLPAVARRRALLPGNRVVRVELRDVVPPAPRRPDPLVANGPDDRAHRRRTRKEIIAKNLHHSVTRVTVKVQRRETKRVSTKTEVSQ